MKTNNQEELFNLFLKDLATSQQLEVVIEDLSTVSSLLYRRNAATLKERISKKVSAHVFNTLEFLARKNLLPKQAAELEDFLASLKKYLERVPQVTLTLAFEPNEDFIDSLAAWFAKNLKRKIVLNIRRQEHIIAGLAVEYNGKYKDFSNRSKLDEVLGKHFGLLPNQQ